MISLLEESRGSRRSPADHRSESRLSIPQRGALQRSSSLLPQPSSIIKRTVEIVENYSVNGKCLIVRLSQLWGAPQYVQQPPSGLAGGCGAGTCFECGEVSIVTVISKLSNSLA